MASPKAPTKVSPLNISDVDYSLESWIYNTRYMLQFPSTILTVVGLLVIGTFAEIAPRKSLDILDNTLGKTLFFVTPLIIAVMLDWSTGLLAAVVALIVLARLQRSDVEEGFSSEEVESTKYIPNSHRWFVEKILGETPVAILSDRISTSAVKDDDNRTNSASSMHTGHTSDSSSANK
jgi:hypothetical protein